MPNVEIAGQAVFYATRGQQGVPVVFVHGAGGNHLIWNGQLSALADKARGYALDLPGHGRSALPGRTKVRDYADAVCRFLDALGLERAVIVGHSMGGATAQTLALEYPERVLGLGLVGTGARLKVLPAFIEGVLTDNRDTIHQVSEAEFGENADRNLKELNEQGMRECNPQVFHDDFVACNEFDVMGRLGEIKAPTLIVCGDQDRMTPAKYSQYLAAQIPGAELTIIPGAGHMVMLEKTDEVNRALLAFLQKVER